MTTHPTAGASDAESSSIRTGGSVTVAIDADPAKVYDLISDVTRIGEWSPECHSADWIGDASGPMAGARFKGRNKWKFNRWARTCEVQVADRGAAFAFRTVPGWGPTADSTTWRWDIEPTEAGCSITQSYEITKMPQGWFVPFIRRFMPHHLDMREHIAQTLEGLKATAESDT